MLIYSVIRQHKKSTFQELGECPTTFLLHQELKIASCYTISRYEKYREAETPKPALPPKLTNIASWRIVVICPI